MQIKKKLAFVINPISGTGKQKGIEKSIETNLSKNLFDYSIFYTTATLGATKIVAEQLNDFDIIVAVGGDGTVNQAAVNLITTEKLLGIIPTGSGNGFARHFHISTNVKSAIKSIGNHYEKIDTAKINNIPFVAFAGLGFDAHIANLFNKAKTRGLLTYIKLSFKAFFLYQEQKYQLELDGIPSDFTAFIIVFANTNQFGNNAKIAPNAICNDGYFEVSIIKKPKLIHSLKFMYDLFNGTLHENKYVITKKAKQINVNQKIEYVNLDGESIFINDSLKLQINPLSLNLITPKNG